ncbi:MAG: lysophospholipid acyltransferase family protein [Pseudomonadota bacterium]
MNPQRRRPGLSDVLRTLLAIAVIFPPLLTGLVVLVVTRDRRRAINHTLACWGKIGPPSAGMRLDVHGGEHLAAARPAVFLINHRSGIDPLIVVALLRRDFVAVAKQEIRNNPVFGPAFAFAGVVFVDRTNPAPDALVPAVSALRAGLSIAIAPEGTRGSRDAVLGQFRSGAFRIAMAARVPVVPIVIHNSDAVLPRRALVMTPAVVRIDVLPPVSTREWEADRLDECIDEVRNRFRRTLEAGAA